MKKPLLLSLSLVVVTALFSVPGFAQEEKEDHLVHELDEFLNARASSMNDYLEVGLNVAALDELHEYGQITGFVNDSGQLVVLENSVMPHQNERVVTRWYFDDVGILKVSRKVVSNKLGDGNLSFNSETKYFGRGFLHTSTTRFAEYKQGTAFNPAEITPDVLVADQSRLQGVRRAFQRETEKAAIASRALKGLRAENGKLPKNLILRSISPNGVFGIQWAPIAGEEVACSLKLLNLKSGESSDIEFRGVCPQMNHLTFWVKWSESSNTVALGTDSKWKTESAKVFRIEGDMKLLPMGALLEAATTQAWRFLEENNHPVATRQKSQIGSRDVTEVAQSGAALLDLDVQSKSVDPDDFVSLQMGISFVNGSSGQSTLLRIIGDEMGSGEKPKEIPMKTEVGKAGARGKEVAFSLERAGPISDNTPFKLSAIKALFPGLKVVQAKEEFEDGGEKDVIYVISEGESILSIIAMSDGKRIGSVYSTSLRASCKAKKNGGEVQFSVPVGTLFSESFQKIPRSAMYEGISGDVIVNLPGAPNVKLRYSNEEPAADAVLEGIPPLAQLYTWKLYSVEWIPAE